MTNDNWKETNPKDQVAVNKVPMMSVLPQNVVGEVAIALVEGAYKYGRHNYRKTGVLASVYADAASRHLSDWWEGTDIDPASGMSHITKAIAGLVVLRDAMMRGMLTDDRPPKSEPDWQAKLNGKLESLRRAYPVREPPITEIKKDEGK